MAESEYRGTFIRIKRRLEDEPLKEIIISKKHCLGIQTNQPDCTGRTVCKRVDSVSTQCDFVQHAKTLLSQRRISLMEMKLNYKKGFKGVSKQSATADVQANSAAKRYKLTACRRGMTDGDGSLLQFKVYQAQVEDDDDTNHVGVVNMSKELLSASLRILPSIPTISEKDDRAITCNGEALNFKEIQYCYDIFHTYMSPEFIDVLGCMVNYFQKNSGDTNGSDTEDMSDNENAEENFRNMYPEDEEMSSDEDDDMKRRLRKLGIMDSCSDISSNDNSDSDECGSTRRKNKNYFSLGPKYDTLL